MRKRCGWVKEGDSLYETYHDREWGVPVKNDRKLFEFIVLESAQAGLSWRTILGRRGEYKKAFAHFDPKKVAQFTSRDVQKLLKNKGIIRNRLKIQSTITNAQAFLLVQKEFGTFSRYMWSFVGGKQKKNKWKTLKQLPAVSKEAEIMSADMKKRGFKFFGPTIAYAHMQAVGMVNDHLVSCFKYKR